MAGNGIDKVLLRHGLRENCCAVATARGQSLACMAWLKFFLRGESDSRTAAEGAANAPGFENSSLGRAAAQAAFIWLLSSGMVNACCSAKFPITGSLNICPW